MKLQPREKKLLAALAIIAFLMVNFFGVTEGLNRRNRAAIEAKRSKARQSQLKASAAAEPTARQTRVWTDKNLLCYPSELEFDTSILKKVQNVGTSVGVSVSTFPKAGKRDPLKELVAFKKPLDLKFSADIEKVVRFFYHLQEKTSMIAVSRVELSVSTKDDAEINVDATVEQWWNPQSDQLLESDSQDGGVAAAEPAEATAPPESAPVPPAPTEAITVGTQAPEAPTATQ